MFKYQNFGLILNKIGWSFEKKPKKGLLSKNWRNFDKC